MLLLLFGDRVDDGYYSGYAGLFHCNPDEVVEFSGADEREEPLVGFALVAVHDLNCGRRQVNLDYAWVLFFCLAWDVLDGGGGYLSLQLVLGICREGVQERGDLCLQLLYMALYPQNVLVVLRGELHKVGEGAEASVLELAESVDPPVEVDLGRHVEEVVLLLLSRAYVEHYDVGYLSTIRRVVDVAFGHRVAPVGIQRMVIVDGIEFRLDLISSPIFAQTSL